MCEFVRQPFKCDFFFYLCSFLPALFNKQHKMNKLVETFCSRDWSFIIFHFGKRIQFFLCRMHSPQCLFYENWYKLFFSKLFTFVYKEMYLYRLFQVRSTKWTRSWIRKCFAHFNWISFDVFDMHVPNHKTYVTHLAWIYMSWWN